MQNQILFLHLLPWCTHWHNALSSGTCNRLCPSSGSVPLHFQHIVPCCCDVGKVSSGETYPCHLCLKVSDQTGWVLHFLVGCSDGSSWPQPLGISPLADGSFESLEASQTLLSHSSSQS